MKKYSIKSTAQTVVFKQIWQRCHSIVALLELQPAHEPEYWGPESPWWRVRAEAGYSSTRVILFKIISFL